MALVRWLPFSAPLFLRNRPKLSREYSSFSVIRFTANPAAWRWLTRVFFQQMGFAVVVQVHLPHNGGDGRQLRARSERLVFRTFDVDFENIDMAQFGDEMIEAQALDRRSPDRVGFIHYPPAPRFTRRLEVEALA